MLFNLHWATLLTWLLGAAYVANGIVNASGMKEMVDNYARWGFPRNWHLVNGAVCLGIGVLLLVPQTTPLGFLVAVLHCIAIYITLIVNRDPGHLLPSAILLVVLIVAYWGLFGFALPGPFNLLGAPMS